MHWATFNSPKRQLGIATLLVALVLLGIVSAVTLASLGFGVQHRREIARETAGRMVREAAQAGLDQAVQFFRAQGSEYQAAWVEQAHLPRWERCAPDDRELPCAIVPERVRANYLKLPHALDMHDVFADRNGAPMPQIITDIGGYPVRYEVYALLCIVDTQQPEQQCLSADSAPLSGELLGPYAITLIARARLRPEHEHDAEEQVAVAQETIAPSRGADRVLAVVPGSWSDAGQIGAQRNHTAP